MPTTLLLEMAADACPERLALGPREQGVPFGGARGACARRGGLARGARAAWVKARLRSTKTPETWVFRAELPYNETGKLLRRVLKDELARGAVLPGDAA